MRNIDLSLFIPASSIWLHFVDIIMNFHDNNMNHILSLIFQNKFDHNYIQYSVKYNRRTIFFNVYKFSQNYLGVKIIDKDFISWNKCLSQISEVDCRAVCVIAGVTNVTKTTTHKINELVRNGRHVLGWDIGIFSELFTDISYFLSKGDFVIP